jgi:Thrombospondin type 3 repeat
LSATCRRARLSIARPFNLLLLAGVILSLVASSSYLAAGPLGASASGTHMDAMSLDMDPTGNTATALGTRETCAIITNNGVVDADEDSVDAVNIDLTATNIPTSNRMIAFQAAINYSEANLTVDSANFAFLLASNPNSNTFNASDPLPDMDDNNVWTASAADTGAGTPEAGSGVLTRFVVVADPGAAAGTYPLTLSDAFHVDPRTVAQTPDQVFGGVIAVDAPCPGVTTDADVSVVSAALSGPATATPGQSFTVTGSVGLHNAGPTSPVNADLTATLSPSGGCSISGPATIQVQNTSLAMSTNVSVSAPLSWSVSCSQPGGALFSLAASAAVDQANVVDPTAANNSGTGQTVVQINAVADIKLTSVTATAPATKTTGTAFPVNVSAVLHNNGPFGPVSVDGFFSISVPPQCFVLPSTGVRPVTQLPVPVSAPTTAAPTQGWFVQCNTYGTFMFTVNAVFAANQQNVTDPNGGNSATSTQATTVIKVPACGPDPDPDGAALQNPSPLLLTTILQLAGGTNFAPEANRTPLDCQFNADIYDPVGAHIDDCKVALVGEEPCTVSMNVNLNDPAGMPPQTPTARLLPNSVYFFDPAFDIAGDLEIPNGSVAGSAAFSIRTDGALSIVGTPCVIDANFPKATMYEGGIPPNVPDSNANSALTNPNLWPNDLNGERAAVENAIQQLPYPPSISLNLRTRLFADLFAPNLGAHLIYSVLIWHIDDPSIATAFGGEWIAVGFPGDPVDDTPSATVPTPGVGGDPDFDEFTGDPISTCAPHGVNITMNGSAGGAVFIACTDPTAEAVIWDLLDPDAVNWAGDDGPRSDASTCSVDVDNDGLTSVEETYYGTDPTNPDTDADGVMDGPDNCPAQSNPNQADYDGDNVGDTCDPDVDGDGTANAADLCPLTAVGSAADGSGCSKAQVDADADGVCNQGAPSAGPPPGCTGSDLCPGTASNAAVDLSGCSQAQVDTDVDGVCNPSAPSGGPQPCTGTDNCPITSNPGQEDFDGDLIGDICDPDDDNDGVSDIGEADCGSDPLNAGARPERVDGVYAGVDDDGDTQVDEPLPAGALDFDCDGDGYAGVAELSIFGSTRDQDPCGMDAWGSDLYTGGVPDSTNRITITDLTSFVAPVRRLDQSPPSDPGWSPRWDLVPGSGVFSKYIAINDLTALIAGNSGFPPMFGGARAFNGPTCVP